VWGFLDGDTEERRRCARGIVGGRESVDKMTKGEGGGV